MKTLILLAAIAVFTGRVIETTGFLPRPNHWIDRR